MNYEDRRKNEEQLRKEDASRIEDKRRLEELRQTPSTQAISDQEIHVEKSANKSTDEFKATEKNNNSTGGFDQVNADYKFVMNNLDKEKEAFQQTKQEKTPAMKKYEKFEKNMPQARRDMVERIKEKSLREANPQQKER